MKRYFCLLCALMILVLSLSGCVRIQGEVTVKRNGKLDVKMLYAVSDSISSGLNSASSILSEYSENVSSDDSDSLGFTDEQIAKFKSEGYTVEVYAEDSYSGYIVSKEDVDLELFSDKAEITKDGNRYKISIPFDTSDEDSVASSLAFAKSMISSQGGYAEFVVNLPVKPLNHNATSVSEDGKTLTWNLLDMGDETQVWVEYKLFPVWAIVCIIAGGAVVLGVIAIVLLVLIKKKLKNSMNSAGNSDDSENSENLSDLETSGEAPVLAEPSKVEKTTELYSTLSNYHKMLEENLISEEDYNKIKANLLYAENNAEKVGATGSVENNIQKTSANTEETPANAEETPANAEETPANAEETPSNAEETPANAEETPANAEETPSNAEETPAENNE